MLIFYAETTIMIRIKKRSVKNLELTHFNKSIKMKR